MSDFKYKFSQVLSLISQAKKENLLTDDERKTIKEHVISEEPDLTLEMEKYNKDQDLVGLVETLKLLAGITKMSSPLDNSLFQKKRDQQHKKRKKTDKNEKILENPGEEVEVQINECEIGNSPVFQPKKLNNKTIIIFFIYIK